MNIAISRHDLLPRQANEEPGMPSYKIEGTIDGAPFAVLMAVEIDGRDLFFSNGEGSIGDENDADFNIRCQDVYDMLLESQQWMDLHNAQTAEFYARHA